MIIKILLRSIKIQKKRGRTLMTQLETNKETTIQTTSKRQIKIGWNSAKKGNRITNRSIIKSIREDKPRALREMRVVPISYHLLFSLVDVSLLEQAWNGVHLHHRLIIWVHKQSQKDLMMVLSNNSHHT